MPTVEIGYSPNDFYYMSSGVYNDISNNCPFVSDVDGCCTNPNTPDCQDYLKITDNNGKYINLESCYNFTVCKNKDYVDLVNDLENNNSGADERRRNLQNQYQNEIIKTINISASILLITYLSVYFFKA